MKLNIQLKNRIICILLFSFFITINLEARSSTNKIDLKNISIDKRGKTDVSAIIQNAIDLLSAKGGGSLYMPEGIFLIKYPLFVPSKINIFGKSQKTIILANISIEEGRCAFLVGDSYEVNKHTINKFREQHVRGWPVNPTFKDIPMGDGLTLNPNDQRIVTRHSSIQNLLIKFDYTNCKANWGGYGIQFSNAAMCTAMNIWTINACQAIGIGSDTPPATPACAYVHCSNIHVLKPDPVHTYYAIGFISNSSNCSITNSDSYVECTRNSPDGSLLAVNGVKSCLVKDISGSVGMSRTSEGILLNNAYGCIIKHIQIQNAKKGIVTFYTNYINLLLNKGAPDIIKDIRIKNCQTGICILSKYAVISGVHIQNCKIPLAYNINTSDNKLTGFKVYLKNKKSNKETMLLKNNLFY